jgi:hypothetical protein
MSCSLGICFWSSNGQDESTDHARWQVLPGRQEALASEQSGGPKKPPALVDALTAAWRAVREAKRGDQAAARACVDAARAKMKPGKIGDGAMQDGFSEPN